MNKNKSSVPWHCLDAQAVPVGRKALKASFVSVSHRCKANVLTDPFGWLFSYLVR